VKLFFLLLLLISFSTAFTQAADTSSIKALYLRCMNFSEADVDSIKYYANFVATQSVKLHFEKGKFYSLRLHELYAEYKSDYEKAVDYCLQALDEARLIKNKELEAADLIDLAILYSDLKQYNEAKEVYLECINVGGQNDSLSLIDTYTNLGAVYSNLKLYDSALFFLKKGLAVGKPLEGKGNTDLSWLYNNLGNAYYYKKEYTPALYYFTINFNNHRAPDKKPDLWIDCLNIADAYSEKGTYDSATKYADWSMKIATELQSRSKEADSYSIISKLKQHEGDYKSAYENLQKWYNLDTAMVNNETSKTVAQLQEQYHARERENEKLVLQAEVDKDLFRFRIIVIIASALLLVAFFIAWAFITKRQANKKLQITNDLIIHQNEKLAELNFEKNSLISIVSHDLGTPFASIGMWSQLLQSDEHEFNEEQKKSISKIQQATKYGENLIRRILDVEKAQTNLNKLKLENFDLNTFAASVIEQFQSMAQKKNIQLHLTTPGDPVYLLSDKELISRIGGNLLSNAIKFTPHGKNVRMNIEQEKDEVKIEVQDEGVGINKEEVPYLFLKYSKISSRATAGEASTGLGLAIVKRIVEELNGKIFCESEEGEGSVFTVIFKK
jgi:signal transduction histidine kinase